MHGLNRRIAGSVLALLTALWITPVPAIEAGPAAPPKLAVFQFELQDSSATGEKSAEHDAELTTLRFITSDVRDAFQRSGRYRVIDTAAADAPAVHNHTLHDCDGCDAPIALALGADQSLVGVIFRVEQGSYAVEMKVRDAHSGKVVNLARGSFLGSSTEWGAGVRSLLRHLLSDAAISPR
jgi:hypothetical protein